MGRQNAKASLRVAFLSAMLLMPALLKAQNISIPSGSFIIDMGVVPQTVGNALKPYGLVYHVIMEHGIPVQWIIDPVKIKDGIDFSYNGRDFKGGPFIIEAPYRTTDVNAEITSWQGQGVIGYTTTSPISVPLFKTLTVSSAPRWTLDKQNGSLAVPYFTNAGIPSSAYGGSSASNWKDPVELNCCDDIFVMPHADPTWATHGSLLTWNLSCKGAIWLGCHAGSALEDMFNPANPSQQTNFLTEKSGTATGPGPYCENALVLWTNHGDGVPPYTYESGGDPIMQFMGTMDAATQNGSEQIFVPSSGGWRSTTFFGGFDPDYPQTYGGSTEIKYRAAVLAYGRGFGDPSRGMVMMESAHSYNKATQPANVAAQRAFFNFAFVAAKTTAPDPGFEVSFETLISGTDEPLSFKVTLPRTIEEFDIQWSSSCGGIFSPDNAREVSFAVPQVSAPSTCIITIELTEKSICGRVYKYSTFVSIVCDLRVTTAVAPACYGLTNGSIGMTIAGGPPPYNWTWNKTGGGSGSGTGTLISNLAPGTYSVNVVAADGTGCAKTFTVTVNQNPQIIINATPSNPLCNATPTGSINLGVSGGTPVYSFLWGDGPTTQNRSGLTIGTYSVTVTDSKGCTNTASATLTQPAALSVTPAVTPVLCNGNSTGAITLDVSGGTGARTYAWNDGATTRDRSGIAAGTYSVTVTDANNCSKTVTGIIVDQPSAISVTLAADPIPCFAGTTTLTATASGGTGTLQYSLNGGEYQTGNTFTVPASGSPYTVTVKDENSCTKSASLLISQPALLVLSSAVVHEFCPGNKNGSIDLTVTGGTGPFTHDWADLPGTSNGEDRTGLGGGTYTVVVTDSKGCTATTTVIVNTLNKNPNPPSIIK